MDSAGIGEEGIDLSALIRENSLRIFKKDESVYDIINAVLEHNQSEDPFFIIDRQKFYHVIIPWFPYTIY